MQVDGTNGVNGSPSTWACTGGTELGAGTGAGGWATVSITNGAAATCTAAFTIGYTGTATMAVDGKDGHNNPSTLTISGASSTLIIGDSGSPRSIGTLSITNGGAASCVGGAATYLAYNQNSAGTVTVDGTNSSWTMSGTLNVGYGKTGSSANGTGTVTITNGGSVSDTTGYLGGYATGTGNVTVKTAPALPGPIAPPSRSARVAPER